MALAIATVPLSALKADLIRLGDGTVLEGELSDPVEVLVKTPLGDRKVAFGLLPAEMQKHYRPAAPVAAPHGPASAATPPAAVQVVASRAVPAARPLDVIPGANPAANLPPLPPPAIPTVTSSLSGTVPVTAQNAVSDEDLGVLAAEVGLDRWEEVATASFRDKKEKRAGTGTILIKGFNALDENWAHIYDVKDPLAKAKDWNEQVDRARLLLERSPQFMQRRWIELFIKAGEAVAQRDSAQFSLYVRELKRTPVSVATAP